MSNHKGGVGKTCSVCNIGAGLARKDKKVLLVDLDPQANLSHSLGVKDAERNIYEVLNGRLNIKSAIHDVSVNLDLVPSTLDLAGAEIELASEAGRDLILKDHLNLVAANYDYIIIDCPPSLGLFTVNALAASNEVLIPLQANVLSLIGITKLTTVIEKIKKRLNSSLRIGGILITQFDARKTLNRDIATAVEEHFADKLFKTRIRDNVSLAEAPGQGRDIFRYCPKSNGAQDYEELSGEILKRHRKLG